VNKVKSQTIGTLQWLYVTTSSIEEAKTIAKTIVEERLAACANILGDIQSIYWWDGKVQDGQEVALILKTRQDLVPKTIERIKALHSYDCPCVIALDIHDGNPDYLNWIATQTL